MNRRVSSQTRIIIPPQMRVRICINKALRQQMPDSAGGGFNLGVDPKKPVTTVTFWHCDTFSLFGQQDLRYSPCFPINTFCFLYNRV